MIIDDLIDILTDEFNLPVYRQGSMSDDATYPEEFFRLRLCLGHRCQFLFDGSGQNLFSH